MRLHLALIGSLSIGTLAAAQPSAPPPAPQGKIISLHGQVEHAAAARQDTWTGAQAFQSLFANDRVRTLVASRAAILFIDETQVKLNAQAVLTVQTIKQPSGAPTVFDLVRGEGWFRTKNPRAGVTITTPAAAAAIRGTEIDVRVGDDGATTLTVVEGAVEFSNPQGSILVSAGEEGTARVGQAPSKRVILNPENAVQWSLYYVNTIVPSDMPGTASSAAAQLAANRAQLAAAALGTGDAETARQQLDAALAADAASIPALTLLSSLELTQNHRERAAALAAAALKTRPDSVGALIAAAESAQADFQLDEARAHLDAALAIDPDQLRALVDRARIRFGVGETGGASADAARAARLKPDDADVRSLQGFIKLAAGDLGGAEADFSGAISSNDELGEPHLGMGLLQFKRGRENEGLLEMLTATLLEPHVSLYQSYLGKAYYETRRFEEGLAALASAKRLDPRDPTPWLYSSFFLRDQNRQVAALNELNEAISRNDFRAVYRSRLLLDRDLATKNVGLAEVYRQLGFYDWAAFEAQKSVETDFANSSAHLFLADAYIGLPDRLQAASSELLQHFLFSPVNRNSFNTFNEYTGLFDQPSVQQTLEGATGTFALGSAALSSYGGNARVAFSARVAAVRAHEVRPDLDQLVDADVTAKIALGRASDMFVNVFRRRSVASDDVAAAEAFGRDTRHPVILQKFLESRDPNITVTYVSNSALIGVKHEWAPGSSFTASAGGSDIENIREDVDAPWFTCLGFGVNGTAARIRNSRRDQDYTLQARQTSRLGRQQISFGVTYQHLFKDSRCHETDLFGDNVLIETEDREQGVDHSWIGYAQDEIRVTRRLHVSGGVRFNNVTYDDTSKFYEPFTTRRFDPVIGVSVSLTPRTVLRSAVFRNINTGVYSQQLAPTTVAGFIIDRNEQPTTDRHEVDAALEHSWTRLFLITEYFSRRAELPILFKGEEYLPDGHAVTTGYRASANWIAASRLGLFGDATWQHVRNHVFSKRDVEGSAGFSLIDHHGYFATVSAKYGRQRFFDTDIADIPDSDYAVMNASLAYEFPRKRGVFQVTADNLLNRRVTPVVEVFSFPHISPRRIFRAAITWQF